MRLNHLKLVGEWLKTPCPQLPLTDFAFDSREVKQMGTLFFALKGARHDGHAFLRAVKKQGAVAAVVDASYQGETAGLALIRVPNVLKALQTLAREVQRLRRQIIIAVTGSVGKTTTKEFIAALLQEKYTVAKTPGNSNSQAGMPLAILRGAGVEEVFVVEMGMTELSEIATLATIAPPTGAVITKVGYSHLDTVPGGLEGIAQAKAEILSSPATQWAAIEYQAAHYAAIRNTAIPLTTYGTDQADYSLQENVLWEKGIEGPFVRLPFSEAHLCEDFVGAAAVCRLMGLSWEEIVKGATKLTSTPLRFEKIVREGITFINDCYNASPESMEAALKNLPRPKLGGKIIAILGEMSVLGSYSDEGHRRVGAIALACVDHLLCFGKRCRPMVDLFSQAGRPVGLHSDLIQLRQVLSDLAKPGDVVLIKGSHSNQLWHLLEG